MWFLLADFRMIQIDIIAGVINHQTILLTFVQTQTTADDLLIQTDRLSRPQNGDKIHMGRIKTGGEYRDIH